MHRISRPTEASTTAAIVNDESRHREHAAPEASDLKLVSVKELGSLIADLLNSTDETRTARVEMRLTQRERNTIQKAAEIDKRSLSDFVVDAAYQAALVSLEKEVVLRLSRRDSEALLAALDSPPEPNNALKRAATRRKARLTETAK